MPTEAHYAHATIEAPSREAFIECAREVLRLAERNCWYAESWWVSGAYHLIKIGERPADEELQTVTRAAPGKERDDAAE